MVLLVFFVNETATTRIDTLSRRDALLISDVGRFVARTATEVHGGMGFTDLLGLHYWFKRIGLNRQLLGAPERVRREAAVMQGWAAD